MISTRIVEGYQCPDCETEFWLRVYNKGTYIPTCPKCGAHVVISLGLAQVQEKEDLLRAYWAQFHSVEIPDGTCPRCRKGTMIPRRGRKGFFWGCSRYPDCRFAQEISPELQKRIVALCIEQNETVLNS